MAKIKVIQYKSGINRPMRQKLTLEALGFTKKGSMHKVIEHEATPQILGMVNSINHLVIVEK